LDSVRTVVAIDGPSGSGKSTAASMLASSLRYALVDSGAMYRVVALLSLEREVDADDEPALAELAREVGDTFAFRYESGACRSFLSDRDVSHEIREVEVARRVSDVSVHPAVRAEMVGLQRRTVDGRDSVVEGRDIGTVVFPDARLKVYMVAGESVRAERRHMELYGDGGPVTREDVASVMRDRDRIDSSRRLSPLRPAIDAVQLDTTDMAPEEVLERLLLECEKRGIKAAGRD
jgi:CMP/dCMP kinase